MAYKVHAGPAELPNPLFEEGKAGEAFLPGAVVVKASGAFTKGATDTVGALLIAKEYGPGQGGHIADAFAVNDHVDAYKARQGLFFRVRVPTGQALVAGETEMERGATGDLQIVTTGAAIAVARETVTTITGDQLVLVEVL
mgnify:CR=1 FL=1